MQIYHDAGWPRRDAAQSVIKNNLYGLDIDKRAYQLSYFALMMKAREYDRRFLSRGAQPNVAYIQESNDVLDFPLDDFGWTFPELQQNLARTQLENLLAEMKDAREYGSLVKPTPCDWTLLEKFILSGANWGQVDFDTLDYERVQDKVCDLLKIAAILAQKYDAVITNPPYMGGGNMSGKLSEYVKDDYSDSKADLFACFIERCLQFARESGYVAMITQHSWMFLSSFEKLRTKLRLTDMVNMAHLGPRAFEEIGGEVVQSTSFVIRRTHISEYAGTYCRLMEPTTEKGKRDMFLSHENFYVAKQSNFPKIPGAPVAYWIGAQTISVYENRSLSDYVDCKSGIMTGSDDYIRLWFEPALSNIKFDCRSFHDMGDYRWFPLNSGGEFRKWYGNNQKIVNLWHNGEDIRTHVVNFRLRNRKHYFKRGITWGRITSSQIAFREVIDGSLFGDAGPVAFIENGRKYVLGFLCSKVVKYLLLISNPTLNFQVRDIMALPLVLDKEKEAVVEPLVNDNIMISHADWDAFETSWDFDCHPMVKAHRENGGYKKAGVLQGRNPDLVQDCFIQWGTDCNLRFARLKANEEKLNHIFIDIYGLQDELTPEVEDRDVTVRRADVQRDVRSLISYAVGCMFGRYSLDSDGLILAGQKFSEKFVFAYVPYAGTGVSGNPGPRTAKSGCFLKVQEEWKSCDFWPVEDNIIPITDENYLSEEDIVTRFCAWLTAAFGAGTLEQNLSFIADALGNTGRTPRETIRAYFLNDFFNDHCATYSVTGSGKRPIYWLFDSGKQNGFKALIYIHRYDVDTVGALRVDYLHRMQRIYASEMERMRDMEESSQDAREKASAAKRKEKLSRQLKECREYDEKIGHLALSRISLDLDDGVKANYRKLQTARDGKFYEVLANSKNIMSKGK